MSEDHIHVNVNSDWLKRVTESQEFFYSRVVFSDWSIILKQTETNYIYYTDIYLLLFLKQLITGVVDLYRCG